MLKSGDAIWCQKVQSKNLSKATWWSQLQAKRHIWHVPSSINAIVKFDVFKDRGKLLANKNPLTTAKQTVSALLHEAREAGWVRAKFEIKPDGSVTIDADMIKAEDNDDFLSADLRMGK